MSLRKGVTGFAFLATLVLTGSASGQQQATSPSYGGQISLAVARTVATAALAEAARNRWPVAVAIVDNAGHLVYYERMDDTQTASPHIAIEKARTSAMFRRPTRALEEAVAAGRLAVLGLPGATPVTGGLPILIDGRVVGGIGVSGVTSVQDEQVARAGVDALR